MWSSLFIIGIAVYLLWKHAGFSSQLPLSFRLQNGLFCLLLVSFHASSFQQVFYLLFHPTGAWDHIAHPVQYLDTPFLVGFIYILGAILGSFAILIGFALAQRFEPIRAVFPRPAKALFLIDGLNFLIGFCGSENPISGTRFFTTFALTIAFFTAIWFWVVRFYESDKYRHLYSKNLEETKKSEQNRSANLASLGG